MFASREIKESYRFYRKLGVTAKNALYGARYTRLHGIPGPMFFWGMALLLKDGREMKTI
jgi:hypothetical protein